MSGVWTHQGMQFASVRSEQYPWCVHTPDNLVCPYSWQCMHCTGPFLLCRLFHVNSSVQYVLQVIIY